MDYKSSQMPCGHGADCSSTCSTTGLQHADISVPISLQPFSHIGPLETTCCGQPHVTLRMTDCGARSHGCELIISQQVCIKIPLEYGACATPGQPSISCTPSCQG